METSGAPSYPGRGVTPSYFLVSLFRYRVGRANDVCGRRFCGGLFNHDLHLHAIVAEAAVVIADRGVGTGLPGPDRYLGRFAWLDVGVDAERLDHEAMRAIFAGQEQLDRLATLQRYDRRFELVALGMDLYGLHGVGHSVRIVGGAQRRDSRRQQDSERSRS